MKRYDKPYIEDRDVLFDLADIARPRTHQPSLTLRRRDLLAWLRRQYLQQLYIR